MKLIISLFLALLPFLAIAKIFDVDVGKNGLKFTPDTITAAPGDQVQFHYYNGGHAVAQSSYSKTCQPSGSNAIYSGYLTPGKQKFVVTIKNTKPIWLYCPSSFHCRSGMNMVINPPASGATLKNYRTRASAGPAEVAPKKVQGGVIKKDSGS